jgi:hypothetical protein
MEWYNDQSAQSLATSADVPAPASAVNASLARAAGAIAGTVTSAPATPVPAAWMVAIGSTGIVGAATTAANGTYQLAGVPAGNYKALFLNPASTTLEYWQDAPDYDSGLAFAVAAGSTSTVDATISP